MKIVLYEKGRWRIELDREDHDKVLVLKDGAAWGSSLCGCRSCSTGLALPTKVQEKYNFWKGMMKR